MGSRAATSIVVVLLVGAACGDSGGTTTSAPAATTAPTTTAAAPTTVALTTTTVAPTTTAAPTTTTTAPPSPADVLAEMERRILAAGVVGDGVPLGREEAGCLAQVIADTLGPGSLDMAAAEALLSRTPADPLAAATADQAEAILAGAVGCVDIVAALEADAPPGVDPEQAVLQAIADGVLSGATSDPIFGLTEDQALCIGQETLDALGLDGLERLALADMLGLGDPDSPLPGATEEQLTALVQTMLDCIDFVGLLSAGFQQDGLSRESADCAARAMLETAAFEVLVFQVVLGDGGLPDDPEAVGEVVQVLLDCLMAEELANLVSEG